MSSGLRKLKPVAWTIWRWGTGTESIAVQKNLQPGIPARRSGYLTKEKEVLCF